MDNALRALLRELESFGQDNDAQVTRYEQKMLNITPDTGTFLSLLVQASKARRILEIGTSNGYSTLWLADAVRRNDGLITTIEMAPDKADMASSNFDRAGLLPWIQLHTGRAGDFLKQQPANAFDFIFLDANRTRYVSWWSDLQRIMPPAGLIVVDNVISHAREVDGFIKTVQATGGYIDSLVPIGKGELLILKEAEQGSDGLT